LTVERGEANLFGNTNECRNIDAQGDGLMTTENWSRAISAMLMHIDATSRQVIAGVPHWADPATGRWTVTPDGDWTGGAWVGQLWLTKLLSDPQSESVPGQWLERIRPRLYKRTAFKGFTFYYGAALGQILFGDEVAAAMATTAAEGLSDLYDDNLGLIPLGEDAEEYSATGAAESSIDSLQASSLLLWSAAVNGNERHRAIGVAHTDRVLKHHVHDDGSVIQSTTVDAENGKVLRSHTHKGFNDTSIWGRAQAWAMLYSSLCALRQPDQASWGDYARRTCDWWLANVPDDLIAYWDFDDPAIPDTSRDTAATAIAASALLKLARLLGEDGEGRHYREAATRTAAALVDGYLAIDQSAGHPVGMLRGGCFTRRPDSRPQDRAAHDVELVFGSYMLLETLLVLDGLVDPARI
jgi:unsaturated chondroitin disaccharide hydrolase